MSKTALLCERTYVTLQFGTFFHPEHDPLIRKPHRFLRKCFEAVRCWKKARYFFHFDEKQHYLRRACSHSCQHITAGLLEVSWQSERVIVYAAASDWFRGKIESLYKESIAL